MVLLDKGWNFNFFSILKSLFFSHQEHICISFETQGIPGGIWSKKCWFLRFLWFLCHWASWVDAIHMPALWAVYGGWSEEEQRSFWRRRGSWSLWSSEKLILSQNYWQFKGFFGEAQSLAGEFISCSTVCLRRNFGFSWHLAAQAKLKLLPCPISQIPAFLKSEG